MSDSLKIAVCQMTSGTTHAGNIEAVAQAAERAHAEGAHMLALPELAGLMDLKAHGARPDMCLEADDPFLAACCDLARAHALWVQAGSTPLRTPHGRLSNTATLIDSTGAIRARYDKIHLFDVFLEGQAPSGESDHYAPGERAVVADTLWGAMGLSICYDLRFPALYRDMATAGARVLFVPAAFTVATGQAHWEVLLRARAIENGAWVVAAAQVGRHADRRTTWGHSLVISPWGETVMDLGGDGPAQGIASLDLAKADAVRRQIPSLAHSRPYRLDSQARQKAAE